MKKLLIALLAAVLASGAFAQTAFPDIPENHWAEDAVARIADLGIVIGFPDGTFRGNEAFTRYQSALVVSRLLDVLQANIEASQAMTDADIASLRNALQELASDVAAQGVRLAASESAIASVSDDVAALGGDVAANAAGVSALGSDVAALGSDIASIGSDVAANAAGVAANAAGVAANAAGVAANADNVSALGGIVSGLGDNVASNSARIADLESAMAELEMKMGEMNTGVDPEVLRDIQNQLAALRVNVDTAAAQADAAAAAAAAANDAAAGATAAAANRNADAANAAAAGAADAAAAAGNAASQALSQAAENADQINAINSVLNLFNGRIEALEARPEAGGDTIINQVDDEAIARNASDIANIRQFVILLRRDQVGIRDRVSALEESDAAQAASITDLQDRVTALEDNPFGLTGTIDFEYFVGRLNPTAVNGFDFDRAYGLNNERSMDPSVFSSGSDNIDDDDDEAEVGEVTQDREEFDQTDGTFDVSVSVSLRDPFVFDGYGSPNMLNHFSAVVTFDFYEIDLTSVDADISTMSYVLSFDSYIVQADFAGIGGMLELAFGQETVASFTDNVVDISDMDGWSLYAGTPDFLAFASPELWAFYVSNEGGGYYRGIHATASFIDNIGGGGSFAQSASMADDVQDLAANNSELTVWGVDAWATLGPIALMAEYASSSTDGAANGTLLYADVTIDTGSIGIPILDKLWAGYASTSDGWFSSSFGLDDEGNHNEDQTGIYAAAYFDLFGLIDLDAYFDTVTGQSDTTETRLAYGVNASVGLPLAITVDAHYQSSANQNGATDENTAGNDLTAGELGNEDRATSVFVGAEHDGDSMSALIPNLFLDFEYELSDADLDTTRILAYGHYTLNIAIVTLTPYVKYESTTDTDAGSDDTTTIAAGTGLETAPLNIFMMPSLEAVVNYRTTDHADTGLTDYTATELQYSVGLTLNEFLMPHSSLTVRYGSWTGTNIQDEFNSLGADDGATDISDGDEENGGAVQSTSGFEVELNWYDVQLAYGVYANGDSLGGRLAQAFSISYTIAW